MIELNNKPLIMLIIVNVVLFMVIFWLIVLIMGNDGDEEKVQTVTITVPSVQQVPAVGVGPVPPMEESDNQGNRHVEIRNSLREVDKIAPQDTSYVEALRELKQGSSKHVSISQVTREQAEKIEARKPATPDAVDRFNKVDVSVTHAGTPATQQLILAEQIDSVVGTGAVKPKPNDAAYAKDSLQDYISKLDTESVERANEMRTIRVKRGDSLWVIAKRAYGSGLEYPRIFKANPHLTNPNLILEGDTLRVPL